MKASRYVKNVMVSMLEHEIVCDIGLNPREGWMFGGLESPRDDARIQQIEGEIRKMIARLSK